MPLSTGPSQVYHEGRDPPSPPGSYPLSGDSEPFGDHQMLTRIVASVGAAALALSLTGCFQNPLEAAIENAVEDQVTNAVEGAIEAETGVDVDLGDGVGLPEDWPSSVPVPDAPLNFATSGPEGWMVGFLASDLAVAEKGAEDLKAAGFETLYEQEAEGMYSLQVQNAEYSVLYTIIGEGDGWAVSMVVTPAMG